MSGKQRLMAVAATAVAVLATAVSPAQADNCSGLSDCSAGVSVAVAVTGVVVVLGFFRLISPDLRSEFLRRWQPPPSPKDVALGGTAAVRDQDGSDDEEKRVVYRAVCERTDHVPPTRWMGPDRATKAESERDARAHNDDNPGHAAAAMEF